MSNHRHNWQWFFNDSGTHLCRGRGVDRETLVPNPLCCTTEIPLKLSHGTGHRGQRLYLPTIEELLTDATFLRDDSSRTSEQDAAIVTRLIEAINALVKERDEFKSALKSCGTVGPVMDTLPYEGMQACLDRVGAINSIVNKALANAK